ncbi:CHAT domain-containing protein [Thalassotalea montiporae]
MKIHRFKWMLNAFAILLILMSTLVHPETSTNSPLANQASIALKKETPTSNNNFLLNKPDNRFNGIAGDENNYLFSLADDEAMLVEVTQENADITIKVSNNETEQVVFLASIPMETLHQEIILVTRNHCQHCKVSVLPTENVDKSGRYSLSAERLIVQEDSERIDVGKLLTQGAIAWQKNKLNSHSLITVQDAYEKAIKLSRYNHQLSLSALYLAAKSAHWQSDFESQRKHLQQLTDRLSKSNQKYWFLAKFSLATVSFFEHDLAKTSEQLQALINDANQLIKPYFIAEAQNLLALTKGNLGLYKQSVKLSLKGVQFYLTDGNWRRGLEAQNNLAWAYYRQGQLSQAENQYLQVASLASKVQFRSAKVQAEIGLADVYRRMGDFQQALDAIDKALVHSDQFSSELIHGRALQAKAQVLLSTDMFELAKDGFEDALAEYQRQNAIADIANIEYFLSQVHYELEDYSQAEFYAKNLLKNDLNKGNPYDIATSYHQLAKLALSQQKLTRALEYQEQAVTYFSTVEDEYQQANLLSYTALILAFNNQPVKAKELFSKAYKAQLKSEDNNGLLMTEYYMAKAAKVTNDYARALYYAKQATHRLRKQLSEERKDIKQRLLAQKLNLVSLLTSLMHQQGESPIKTLALSESFRSMTLNQRLQQVKSTNSLSPELQQEKQVLIKNLHNEAVNFHQLANSEKRAETLKKVRSLTLKLQRINAFNTREKSPKNNNSKHIDNLDLALFQQTLTNNDLVLYFDTAPEQSSLWLMTSENVEVHQLAGEKVIQQQVIELLSSISVPPARRTSASKTTQKNAIARLSSTLLANLSIDWGKFQTLTIVPDGPLSYLPFSLLTIPEPTNENKVGLLTKQISYAPSLTVLNTLKARRSRQTDKSIFLVANPRMAEDPRFARVNTNNLRGGLFTSELPYSQKEADSIMSLANQPVTPLIREQADKENVLKSLSKRYQILHFATHGVANSRSPALSGLVLSNANSSNNLLLAPEIANLVIDAELVVLSGCQTAVGPLVNGEGLQGLSRVFFEAGASRVIASLWAVQDDATAHLMSSFYQFLLIDGLAPAAALQSAKLAVKQYRRKNGRKPWQDPFYWAGFTLQGIGGRWHESK